MEMEPVHACLNQRSRASSPSGYLAIFMRLVAGPKEEDSYARHILSLLLSHVKSVLALMPKSLAT